MFETIFLGRPPERKESTPPFCNEKSMPRVSLYVHVVATRCARMGARRGESPISPSPEPAENFRQVTAPDWNK